MAKDKIVVALPVLCAALGITVLSHIPQPPMPDMGFSWQDKVWHLIAYTAFGATLGFAVRGWHPEYSTKKVMGIVLVGTALFGVYDEFHQSFVPNRDASIADWVADSIGGMVSLFVLPFATRLARGVQLYFSHSEQE